MQSVNDLDDLYPEHGAEEWGSKVQRPQAHHLQGRVELVLSDNAFYEYKCPTHTASELLQLSQTHSRLELHGVTDCRFYENTSVASELTRHIEHYNSMYGSKL